MAPLLPYFLAYLAGILIALPASIRFVPPAVVLLLVVSAAMFTQRFWKKFSPGKWAALFALFGCGIAAPGLSEFSKPGNHVVAHLQEGKPAQVEGTLLQPPLIFQDRVQYHIGLVRVQYRDQAIEVTGRARITFYPGKDVERIESVPAVVDLQAGDLIRFKKIRLKRPRNFKNPGRFDYERFMRSRRIDVIGSVSKPERIIRLGSSDIPLYDSLRENLKSRFASSLDSLFTGEESALLKAMLLGEKRFLSEATRDAYIVSGLSHLMAVSGLHIGFVAGASYFLFWTAAFYGLYRVAPQWVLCGHSRKLAALLCIVPVVFYMILAGPKISALRAGMMVVLCLLAVTLNRVRSLFNVLIAAAFLILLWDPHSILDIGFQMSFMAMLCILTVLHRFAKIPEDPVERMGEPRWWQKPFRDDWQPTTDPLSATDRLKIRLQRILIGSALVSLAAILGTLPILIFHFNRISLVGFFLNVLMVPLASLLIPLALFVVSLGMLWPALAGAFAFPVLMLLKLFLFVPKFFALLPYASILVPTPPKWWFWAYYFVFFAGFFFLGKEPTPSNEGKPSRQVLLKTGCSLAAVGVAVWLIWPRLPQFSNDQLQVTFLDVGQGESIFIEFPNRETMLLDGGGFYRNILDVGKVVVAPFLLHQGIGRIDYLAASHSDNDHIRGLESIVQLFPVGHYLDRAAANPDRRIERLRARVLANHAEPVRLQTGTPLNIGGVRLVPLHPDNGFISQIGDGKRQRIGNDLSLVLRLEYKNFSMLLTGDIGEKAEDYLVKNGVALEAEFLKAPHHGSRFSNSASFIEAVKPRAVFFSSGYLNWMRLPHPESLRRYREFGAEIWRTDRHGAIRITTDGYRHRITSHEFL